MPEARRFSASWRNTRIADNAKKRYAGGTLTYRSFRPAIATEYAQEAMYLIANQEADLQLSKAPTAPDDLARSGTCQQHRLWADFSVDRPLKGKMLFSRHA